MKKTSIVALKGILSNLELLIKDLEADNQCSCNCTVEADTQPVVASSKPEVEPVTSTASEKLEITKEYLDSLTYTQLKSLAKNMGISGKGTRDDLVAKILGDDNVDNVEVEAAPVKQEPEAPKADEKPVKAPNKLGKKLSPKKEEVEAEEIKDDPNYSRVVKATEDMTDEEIMDYLHDCGIKAKGKREALIAHVVKAVREGIIELEDDEGETSEPVDSEDAAIEGEVISDSEVTEDEPEMTEERAAAISANNASNQDDFDNGNITREDLIEWYLDSYDVDKETVNKMTDTELLDAYNVASADFIDDDGEMHDNEEAYLINGEAYCCGTKCKYSEDDNSFICECCGGEYDASDE